MSQQIQSVSETTTQLGDTTNTTTQVTSSQNQSEHVQNTVVNVIWYIVGLVESLLLVRFVLALLGANTLNTFANFIYSVSHPFVAPFFSLFSYKNTIDGIGRLEVYTVVAMIVYALVGYGVAKLATINRR